MEHVAATPAATSPRLQAPASRPAAECWRAAHCTAAAGIKCRTRHICYLGAAGSAAAAAIPAAFAGASGPTSTAACAGSATSCSAAPPGRRPTPCQARTLGQRGCVSRPRHGSGHASRGGRQSSRWVLLRCIRHPVVLRSHAAAQHAREPAQGHCLLSLSGPN